MLRILRGIHDAVEAEMSPGGRDGCPSQDVIDNFPPGSGQHIDGIGPGVAIDRQRKNKILVADRFYLSRFYEGGILNRRQRLHQGAGLEGSFFSACQAQ